jgi:RHS repeat-associated protein
LAFPDSLTRHGWTGHEHADPVGVVQMGGRLYDAEAGRFVQPDPFVQDPFDGQSLNRYSYLLNNPLSGTDPSGYWGAKEQGYLRTVVAIVIAVYTGYYINTATTLTTAQAAGYAALGGAASGAVATGTLRGAVTGAYTASIGFGIGQAWGIGTWQYIAANAVAGGITEELNGGRFGHGFVSAGLSAAIAPQINTGNAFGDGVAYAMLGGTTSVISGGKFANGAATGALQFAMGKMARRGPGGHREGISEQNGVSLEVGGSRPLTEGEIAMSKDVFGNDIDYSLPRVFRRTYSPIGQRRGVAVAPNGNIYFHPSDYVDDFSSQGISGRAWFMHEMTHIWQHQQGVNVALRGIFSRQYEYLPLESGKAFRSYGIEQQGDIVRDYYLLRQGYHVQGAPPISTYQSLLPFGR